VEFEVPRVEHLRPVYTLRNDTVTE
jgi:hypothetical protein